MNWKNILLQNLKILSFDHRSLSTRDIKTIFDVQNITDFQAIILYAVSRVSTTKHEEFKRLVLLSKDTRSRMELWRSMHTWCQDIISETFKEYRFEANIFVNPVGTKVYEVLGRLTTSLMKYLVMKVPGDNSAAIRAPINLTQLKSLNISSKVAVTLIKQDFIRESEQYFFNMKCMQSRKDILMQKMQTRQLQILSKEIQLKDKERIYEEIKSEMIDFLVCHGHAVTDDHDSVEVIEQMICEHADKVNARLELLMAKIDELNGICEEVKEFCLKKDRAAKICWPTEGGQDLELPPECYGEHGRLSIAGLVKFTNAKLAPDTAAGTRTLPSRELSRITDSLTAHLANAQLQLDDCRIATKRIASLRDDITAAGEVDASLLGVFGPCPSIGALLQLCDEERCDQVESSILLDDQDLEEADLSTDRSAASSPNNVSWPDKSSFFTLSPSASAQDLASVSNDFSSGSSDNAPCTIDAKYLMRSPLVRPSRDREPTTLPRVLYQHSTPRSSVAHEGAAPLDAVTWPGAQFGNDPEDNSNFFEKSNDSFLESINDVS